MYGDKRSKVSAPPPRPLLISLIQTKATLAITVHDHLFQIPSMVEKRMVVSFHFT